MENIKPTLSRPVSAASAKVDNQFKQLDEVDNMLNEKEMSFKKKIFSLPKMEALTFSDPKLTAVYDSMAESGSERYGYHYNETILNLIFNDYVLNSSKYLQKYKMAIPKVSKRRDRSGINQLKKAGLEKMHSTGTKVITPKDESVIGTAIEETTSAGSAGGAAGYVGYAGPSAWSKSGKPKANKPMLPNGVLIQESLKNNDYLTDPKMFKLLIESIEEPSIGIDQPELSQKSNTTPYTNAKVNNRIINDTSAFSSNTIKQWNKPDTDLEIETLNGKIFDKPRLEGNVDEKAVSKAQQRFMGMVHGVQTGDIPKNKVSGSILKTAKSMKSNDVEDFASTKHKNLPDKIEEYDYNNSNPKQDNLTPDEVVAQHIESLNKIASKCENMNQLGNVLKVYLNNNNIMHTPDATAIIKAAAKLFKEKGQTPIDEGTAINDMKIQKIVEFINSLIAQAVDMYGDPIPVLDNTQTWEQPYVYSPIEYRNGRLKIVSTPQPNYNNAAPDVDVISKPNMEYDGIPTLRLISRMYKKAIKNKDKYNARMKAQGDEDNYDDQINEESQTMVADNPTSMKMQAPQGTQASGMDVGMNTASAGGGMSENINIIKNTEDMTNKDFNECNDMLSEIEELAALQESLKIIAEDRKTSSMVLVDRLHKDNASNFKSDFKNSDTSQQIKDENDLMYADQQTDVDKNPYKAGEDIEKASTKESFKNVGNSTNLEGDEIPKRNMTEDEQEQVANYKLGLGDVAFDGEVGKRYEDRMKADMGDERYAQRQINLKTRANMPMYNKEAQPTISAKDETKMESKYSKNLAEAVMITGRYSDILNKSHMFDFMLNECLIANNVESEWFAIKVDGLGNTYANKLNENTSKLDVNENVSNVIEAYKFYLGENKTVYAVKNSNMLNESVEVKTISEDVTRMKHLLGYQPKNFVSTSNNKRV